MIGEPPTVNPVGIINPIEVTVPEVVVNVPVASILSPEPIFTTPKEVVVAIGKWAGFILVVLS